jgi:hypothetical protein
VISIINLINLSKEAATTTVPSVRNHSETMITPVRLINIWHCVAGYAGAGGDQYNAPQQPQQGSGYGYGHQCTNFLHAIYPPATD